MYNEKVPDKDFPRVEFQGRSIRDLVRIQWLNIFSNDPEACARRVCGLIRDSGLYSCLMRFYFLV